MRTMRWILLAALAVGLAGCAGDSTQAEPSNGPAAAPAPSATPANTSADETAKTLNNPPPAPPAPDSGAFAVAHEYTRLFYEGQIDLLHQKFSDEMSKVLSLEQLSALYEQVLTDYGKETGVIAEDRQEKDEYRAFVRWARFDKTEEVIEVQWILRSSNDEIAGFFIRPAQRKVEVEGR